MSLQLLEETEGFISCRTATEIQVYKGLPIFCCHSFGIFPLKALLSFSTHSLGVLLTSTSQSNSYFIFSISLPFARDLHMHTCLPAPTKKKFSNPTPPALFGTLCWQTFQILRSLYSMPSAFSIFSILPSTLRAILCFIYNFLLVFKGLCDPILFSDSNI